MGDGRGAPRLTRLKLSSAGSSTTIERGRCQCVKFQSINYRYVYWNCWNRIQQLPVENLWPNLKRASPFIGNLKNMLNFRQWPLEIYVETIQSASNRLPLNLPAKFHKYWITHIPYQSGADSAVSSDSQTWPGRVGRHQDRPLNYLWILPRSFQWNLFEALQ